MEKNSVHSQRIADRFEIRNPEHDLLGRGSMGDVYRATDTHTGEAVAVKALDPRVVARDPGILERFVREGEALRQLNHPNIVRMVAAVEDEGRHYLVMEYVAGGSLQDLLDAQGPLPVSDVLEIALDLADALTRAHRLGIIHRDLKPANVLLAEDGTPRLTDFGIAHVSEGPRLTQTGILMGTPDFLSPEACEGKAIDERGDIWAFGVLLFEMLTGETPFAGDTLAAKLAAILTQPVPDLGERCPDAPEALVDLIYRMLEKDRQQRIPSVRLVGAELEAILKGREVPTPLRLAPGESRFSTPTPDTTRPRHNLPAQPTPFVGREAELTELARLLADPDVRLLTILGAGGMGKTRLALEAGAAQLGNFQHGVYFVSLAPLDSVEAIVPTTAGALGFSFYEGGEPRQQLLDYLREKNKLLIMDNFEHLLAGPEPGPGDGVGLVTDILQTAPEVKILSTSRARLNVQGECLFHLAGMDVPQPLPAAEAETPGDTLDYSAVKLFLQSARRVKPGFELATGDLKYVARICRLVAGMPLGILLAAAWLTMLKPAEISAEIESSLDFLETDQRDVPERQRSLRAVFDHSWNLLTERQRAVMQALSVFHGGFTRQAATEVTGASLRELRSLVDKSLLQRDPAGRYGIHELLRQYAADKLRRADKLEVRAEEDAVRDRHCAYFAEFLQQREAQLIGRAQKQALAEVGAETENVRAAWDWAVAQGKIKEIDCSLESLAEFYRIRAWFQEGEEAFARAAQRLAQVQEEIKDHTSKMVLAKVLLQQGQFCRSLGLLEKASELTQRSLAIFRDLGAQREVAYALCSLGYLVALRGGEGKPLNQEALATSKEIGDQRGIALSLWSLGLNATDQGEYGTARQRLQESLALFRELGNHEGIAGSLGGLGYIAWLLGEYGEAEQLHQESLARSREVGDQRGMANALSSLLGDVAGLEQYGQAKQLGQESLAIFREIGDLFGVETAVGNLGELANVLGEYAEAIQLAQECLTISRKIDEPSGIAWALRILGDAACGLGDLPGARRYHHQALEVVTTIGQKFYVPLNLVGIAALLAEQDDKEKALELLALVTNHRFSWQWAKDQAAPLIAQLEAELPPEVVEAAHDRGRARDLDATVVELLDELGGTGTDSLDQPAGNS
jgi:predicted ATPase/predicted Ser/Thr protein kinase